MKRRWDTELFISTWSPDWIDGSGVLRVADWYMSGSQGWQISEVFDIDNGLLSEPMDMIRTSGYTVQRSENAKRPPDTVPVIYELNRLRKGRGGPLEERIVEHALSFIPCEIGLHAVDIRRPVAEDALVGKRRSQTDAIIREVMSELRALCAAMPLAWAMCSTYGRGPSVAELFRKEGSRVLVDAVYVPKSIPTKDVVEAFHPARVVDIGPGYEIVLTKLFGGPMETVPNPTYDALWKILRKTSITGLPWEIIRSFDTTT